MLKEQGYTIEGAKKRLKDNKSETLNVSVIAQKLNHIKLYDVYLTNSFYNIKYIRRNDYDLVFANTINNGVSAYFQQNKYNLIPKQIMDLEYPPNGLCGSLWESGTKAELLHDYFIKNYKEDNW